MAAGSGSKAAKALAENQITIQLVVPSQALAEIGAMPDVTVTPLIAKCAVEAYPELTCNITGQPSALTQVLQVCSAQTSDILAPRLPPLEPTAPDDPCSNQLSPTEDLEGKVDAAADSEPPTDDKGEVNCSCDNSVTLGAWNGCVELLFQWDGSASPYSEYLDPDGSNWWHSRQGSARRAPAITPSIQLEWRQGVSDEWKVVDAVDGKARLTLQPEKVSQMNFNGFQSRWIVDGERYLHHMARAPSLIPQLMLKQPISTAIKMLPREKQAFESLKDPTILNGKPVPRGKEMYDAVMMVENILPQNTWDIAYSCSALPGQIANGKHVMTYLEKAQFEANAKLSDPATMATLRKEALKLPLRAAVATASAVKIPMPITADSFDMFMPSSEPEQLVEELLELGGNASELELKRRALQDEMNLLHPEYSGGVRISLPSVHDLQNAASSKRPFCDPVPCLPVAFEHNFNKVEDYKKEHAVCVQIWLSAKDSTSSRTLELKAEKGEESGKTMLASAGETVGALTSMASGMFGKTSAATSGKPEDTYPTWKKYTGCFDLEVGEYCYVWTVDGVPFYNGGLPLVGTDLDSNHCRLTVQCEVRFGIGVQMM